MLRPDERWPALAGKVVDTYDFPDGRLEIRCKGLPLPYSVFDHLQRVSHAPIVENKRLGEVLACIKQQQDQQPHHRGDLAGPRRSNQKAGLMKDRARFASPKPQNHQPDPPAWAAAAAILGSPQRRPKLPQKPPSDISTLQRMRHLNLVATCVLAREGHGKYMATPPSASAQSGWPDESRGLMMAEEPANGRLYNWAVVSRLAI
jgi:hypothetical protein